MKKMTRDLLNNTKAIMSDAQNLHDIGAVAEMGGDTPSFRKYFDDNYTYDTKHDELFGYFMTDEQQKIYEAYTAAVAEELFYLNHPNFRRF